MWKTGYNRDIGAWVKEHLYTFFGIFRASCAVGCIEVFVRAETFLDSYVETWGHDGAFGIFAQFNGQEEGSENPRLYGIARWSCFSPACPSIAWLLVTRMSGYQ